MFIHNSVITLMPEPILSVSMCGNQLKSDWPSCVVTGCQTSNCDEYCSDRCSKHFSNREEGKVNTANITNVAAGTSSGSSNAENINASSKSEKCFLVYHRRKQRVKCDDFTSTVQSGSPFSIEQKLANSQVRDSCGEELCIDKKRLISEMGSFEEIFLMTKLDDHESSGLAIMPDSTKNARVKGKLGNNCKSDSKYCINATGSCFSSKPNIQDLGLSSRKMDSEVSGECSSSDIRADEFTFKPYSESEVDCSSRLRCAQDATVFVSGKDVSYGQSCKLCNLSDSLLNMLICDNCEEAFHLSCCNPEVTNIKIDEWFCEQCHKKKPKRLLEVTKRGKPKKIIKGISGYKKKLRSGSSLISFMLEGTEPYDSGVRIGEGFQAEVAAWSGPVFSDTDRYDQLDEMDPAECMGLHGWNSILSAKQKSIGNWLQCREVICDNTKDVAKEIVCGKWRRAPFFEAQTDDWDCSCSVLWDPVHADCAVPQEISTEEVMMHLKYVKLLRPQLAGKKRKISDNKRDGSV